MGERERLKESEERRVTAEAALGLARETMAMMQRDLDRTIAALDVAEREASLRLDRIFMLRLCVQQLGPKELLDADDAAMRERPRKYGPMAVTVDKPGGLAFVGHTGDTYAEGRAIREATSALNPGGRVRLWRLVCVEDWYRLPGEEAPHADPYAATPAQVRALWSVADAAKTTMGFLASFFKRGSHRAEAKASIVALGKALDALDALREVDRG